MSIARKHLSESLKSIVNADSIEAIIECTEAFDDKNDIHGLLSFLQDMFNIGKERELEAILKKYLQLRSKPDVALIPAAKPTQSKQPPSKQVARNVPALNSQNNNNTNKSRNLPSGKQAVMSKPTTVPKCKCMANLHKFFASCVACGWIMCEKDNETNTCTFCGVGIVPPMSAQEAEQAGFDEATVKAYASKDKLLLFDKEHAKRTHVHDAQADYYDSSVWLSEEEKRAIDEKEKKRRANKNKLYANRKINISFDISGRKVVEYQTGFEDVDEGDEHMIVADTRPNIVTSTEALLGRNDVGSYAAISADTMTPIVPAGMHTTVSSSAVVNNAASNKEPTKQASSEPPVSTASASAGSAGVGTIIYDDNRELEYHAGQAGEVYRFMKKSWEDQDIAKLKKLGQVPEIIDDHNDGGGGSKSTTGSGKSGTKKQQQLQQQPNKNKQVAGNNSNVGAAVIDQSLSDLTISCKATSSLPLAAMKKAGITVVDGPSQQQQQQQQQQGKRAQGGGGGKGKK